jgi:hypothetical protein
MSGVRAIRITADNETRSISHSVLLKAKSIPQPVKNSPHYE